MTDILAEACKTLGPRYSDYGFKLVTLFPSAAQNSRRQSLVRHYEALANLRRHNNKPIDMSRRFRETNLASVSSTT